MQIRSHNGLFDETNRMPQSSRSMKWLGISLVAMVSGLSVWAMDTNVSATIDTNLPSAPDAIYAELTNSLAAETNAPENARQLSLEDCIQLTLQHNIELQIDRYSPQIALFALKGAYAPYDPTAAFS